MLRRGTFLVGLRLNCWRIWFFEAFQNDNAVFFVDKFVYWKNYVSYIVTKIRNDGLSAGQSDRPIFIRFSVANASKTKRVKFRLTKFLPSHFFSWARFVPQVEPKRCLCGAAGPHSRFFKGRLRISSSWWSFSFASWTGIWSSFPSKIWEISTVVLWRRASLPGCSLFHPFASEFTDYRDVPYQRQILLLRMGIFFQRSSQLSSCSSLRFSLQDYQFLRGSSIDGPQASFEVRDSRATSSPPGSRALAGQAWVVES